MFWMKVMLRAGLKSQVVHSYIAEISFNFELVEDRICSSPKLPKVSLLTL